jgi:histidinol dehydrogenase
VALRIVSASDRTGASGAGAGWLPTPELVRDVAAIVAAVRLRGDAALVEYTRRFDDAEYDLAKLRVPIPMEDQARSLIPPEIADALKLVKDRVLRFHERQRLTDVTYADEDGTRYGLRRRAYASVAAYAPGGATPHPTSIVMTAAVAKLAGVDRVIVLTPPQRDGRVHPAVLYACMLCDVDELYAVGGPHAIAAAAFGTESIAPVDKIVGAGGMHVTEAKRQVYGACAIDGLHGQQDVLVVADDGASSEYVVAELLAQAEQELLVRVGVVSESLPLLESVAQLLDTLEVNTLPRGDVVSHVIEHTCTLVHARNRKELLESVDRFAPGYLSLQVRDPEPYLEHLRNVGCVLVGDMTPIAAGIYLAGTNRVVPGGGMARLESALSLNDFVRCSNVVDYSRERLLRDAPTLAALAELEGRPGQAQSARMRSDSSAPLAQPRTLPAE